MVCDTCVSIALELTNMTDRLLVDIFDLVRHFVFVCDYFKDKTEPGTAVAGSLYGGCLAGC